MIRIKEAINHYNKHRKRGEPKMTQRSLAEFVMQDQTQKQAEFYISKWCKGEQESALKTKHVILICLKTGVSPDFLYNWDKVIENEKSLKDEK